MLRHWITISWRVLGAHRLFSLITILSLGIGCAGALLIGSYIYDQLTYEDWLPASDRILRLEMTRTPPGGEPSTWPGVPGGIGPLIKTTVAGVADVTRWEYLGSPVQANLVAGDTSIGGSIERVESNFFDVFELPFLEGSPATALADPAGLVITKSMREALFGGEPALGRNVSVGSSALDSVTLVVSGVIEDLPRKTHLRRGFVGLVPLTSPYASPLARLFSAGIEAADGDFGLSSSNWATYVRAESRADARALRSSLPAVAAEAVARHGLPADEAPPVFRARPIREIHLYDRLQQVSDRWSNLADLSILAAVGSTLLIVCAFNYVMLSLARAMFRTREVGVRKAMGASRGNLVLQHLVESTVLTGAAVVIGLAIAELAFPWFTRAIERPLEPSVLHGPSFLALAAAGGFMLAVLVGVFPALYLSGLRPASVAHGNRSGAAVSVAIRYFVGAQFAVATGLIGVVAVMALQARYISTESLGYDYSDRLIVTPGGIYLRNPVPRLRQALASSPGILAVSAAGNLPLAEPFTPATHLLAVDGEPRASGIEMRFVSGPLDLPRFYSTELLAGRWFDERLASDRFFVDSIGPASMPERLPVIVTAKTAAALGAASPADAVGRTFRVDAVSAANITARTVLEVAGVVGDVRYDSLRFPVQPVVFIPNPLYANTILVHFDPGRRKAAIEAVRRVWPDIYSDRPPNIRLFEDYVKNLYIDDWRLMRLASGFSFLAVCVACMGLYGLSAFAVRRRHHEIAIRKSLGASSAQMTRFMALRFVGPVLVAIPLGLLGTYLFAREWLLAFANRIALTPLPFLGAGILAFAIAAATVYAHARGAARTSPAVVLRDI